MSARRPARDAVRAVAERLAAAGVDSPGAEAELLVAHVLGVDRRRLPLADAPGPEGLRVLDGLVARRVDGRVPPQYLTGTAVSGALDLEVGPGVFVPRPETELLVADGLTHLPPPRPGGEGPLVVDLCAGSGTLALELAHARPDARVHAVELHDEALHWLRRNAAARAAAGDTPVTVHPADATDPGVLADLRGRVDLVVTNPPYIPAGTPLPPEVGRHEPATALFGGADGLDVIRPLAVVAAGLLRPGGRVVVEHDDTTGESVAAVFAATGGFGTVERHNDLAGRPRYVTAVRTDAPGTRTRDVEKGSAR